MTGIGIYSGSTSQPAYSLFNPVFNRTYYLENSSPTGLPIGNSNRTIVGWVKVSQPTNVAQVIFGYGSDSGDTDQTEIVYNDSNRELSIFWNQFFAPVEFYGDSRYVLAADVWYFVAVTYIPGFFGINLYRGNSVTRQAVGLGGVSTVADIIRVGLGCHHLATFDNLFQGNIEKIGVWDRKLSNAELDAYFAIGRVSYTDLPRRVLEELVPQENIAQCRSVVKSVMEAWSQASFMGWWLLNGGDGVPDSSTNEFDGTLNSGSYQADVPYMGLDLSLEFDGSSTYASIPAEDIFNKLPISISVWIKTSVDGGGIINKYISSSDNGWQIYIYGGHAWAWYFGTGGSVYGGGDGLDFGAVTDGNWHHLVFTVGQDGGKTYLDATLVTSQAWVGTMSSTTDASPIVLGHYDAYFNGFMSDVRVYNDVIDQSDITIIYNGGNINNALGFIETSDGSFLESVIGNVADLYCSNGDQLLFNKLISDAPGPVSFWNLSESSGTRHDSVGDNDLNEVDVHASFGWSGPVQAGVSLAFTDLSTLASSWFWDFGDSSNSTDQNPSHVFSAGSYDVTLTINGGGHDSWVITNNITVANPTASFTDNSPQTQGQAIAFTDTSSFPNDSWSWDFGDGSGSSTSQNPSYTYSSSGTFTVTLTIASGASSITHDVTINIAITEIWQRLDLSSYFNVIGIANSPGGGAGTGLDGDAPGSGDSTLSGPTFYEIYSNPITVGHSKFNFPIVGDGHTNNTLYCNGQTITLSGGKFDHLYMLGFAVNGAKINKSFTVTYDDSSTNVHSFNFSDWFNDGEGDTIVLGNDGNLFRTDSEGPITIKEYTIPLDRTKRAVSLTIPSEPFIDIFSITEAITVPQPQLWVSADTISASNGDSINIWSDLSGSGNDLTQEVSYEKPVFLTNIQNGLPAVRFAGNNLSGNAYTAGQYLTGSIVVPGNYTVLTVMKRSNADGYFQVAESIGNATGNTFWNGYIASNGVMNEQNDLIVGSDSHNDLYNPNANNETSWHLCEARFNGTYLEGWDGITLESNPVIGQNNPDANNNVSSGALSSGNVYLGCYPNQTLFFNGYIAETLIFNTALSDSDRTTIESYLLYKWKILPQNCIQQLSFTPTPTGGTYLITIAGQNVSSILYNATSENLQTAINGVLGAGSVSVSTQS